MDEGEESSRNANSKCACFRCNIKLMNVIILGIGFMFLFTAFQTSSMIEKTVLADAKNDTNGSFSGNGYTSLSIIYGVFAASNWAAPPIVSLIGPKLSMIFGGSCYCLFIASFLKPMTWALYVGSALVGIGAAVLWTAQGNFLTINSDSETMGRNSGIFWALLQMSLLFGNLYEYFALEGSDEISDKERFTLYSVFTVLGVIGVVAFILLRSVTNNVDPESTSVNMEPSEHKPGPWAVFKSSVKLLFTRDMLLLSMSFAYTGLELTFWSGVYGTCIGATKHFGESANQLIGLSGIFIGVGEILGGGLFGILSKKTNQYGRDPIILLGFFVHMVAFFITFASFPAASPQRKTSDPTYFEPKAVTAIVGAFLLGFGDSCFNTQIYSLLGSAYSEDSAPAFALFKFLQSLASAVAFSYSNILLLHLQLLIMVIMGVAGTLSFFLVEWKLRSRVKGYERVTGSD